jgi:hypothetical protein
MAMRYALLLSLLLVGSCASPQNEYCASFGVQEGHPEFGRCLQYYAQQESAFEGDRAVCASQADQTYPPSLYSRPTSYPVRYPGYGGFGRTEMVHVGADYRVNAQLDALRMRIIEPCMQSRGWNSGATWQAGRHAITPQRVTPLPWQ